MASVQIWNVQRPDACNRFFNYPSELKKVSPEWKFPIILKLWIVSRNFRLSTFLISLRFGGRGQKQIINIVPSNATFSCRRFLAWTTLSHWQNPWKCNNKIHEIKNSVKLFKATRLSGNFSRALLLEARRNSLHVSELLRILPRGDKIKMKSWNLYSL